MTAENKALHYLTIHEAHKLIQSGALSPVELTRAIVERIDAVDGQLHAFVNLMADTALEEARIAEAEILRGNYRGPMHGIPVAVKDQLHVEDAGVSAGLCMDALGEDTAGSIRNPASLCGIVGFKATYGRVSRHGLAPLGWSLDHCGPMTRVVEDAAHMLQAIAGYDPKDPTSINLPVPEYGNGLRADVRGIAIGVPRDFIALCRQKTSPEILQMVDEAIGELESFGARIQNVSLPTLKYATQANAVIYYNEHYAGHREEAKTAIKTGATARRARIYFGVLTGSADYLQAQRIRSQLKRECAEVFQKVDVLALPCQTSTAPKFEEVDALDTLRKHLAPEYHAPLNLAGLPAISIPCGFSRANLPVALQLVGKPFDELAVLRAAYTYQQHARWYEKRPPI